MNVKQEPFDPHERVKTEPNFDTDFKNEHDIVLDKSVFQTTEQFEIKEAIIKCEVPKIEQDTYLPIKIDYDTVLKNVKIKREPEDTNDFRQVQATDLLVDIIKGEQVQVKTESELLTTHCDLPNLKNEGTDIDQADYYSQPCSSKQVEKILKVCKKRRMYPCPVCQKNFHTSKSRSKHIDGHFGKRSVVYFPSNSRSKHIDGHFRKRLIICEFCGKFMNKIYFLRHYFIHVVNNRIKKSQSKYYIYEKRLNSNLCYNELKQKHFETSDRIFTNGKPFKCDICSKQFNYRSHLQQHLLIHTNEYPFKCDICSKEFNLKSNLQRHSIIHTCNKPFNCGSCSKGFNMKASLQRHFVIHTNKKIFKCYICAKQFNNKALLHQHLLNHASEEKPFKCDICSKKFNLKSILQRHLLIHTNDKPFKCDICSKRFNIKTSLQRHLRIHSNEKSFKCDICSKGFHRKFNLREHLKIIHTDGKPFKCEVCSKEFNVKSNLQKHLLIHTNEKPFKCDICMKQFSCENSLQPHLLIHANEELSMRHRITTKFYTFFPSFKS